MSTSEISPVESTRVSGDSPKAWWRFPFVWLVVGGPLIVVVASISTAVIAIRGADPVLEHDESGGEAPTLKQHAQPTSLTPAMAARNNAATAKP